MPHTITFKRKITAATLVLLLLLSSFITPQSVHASSLDDLKAEKARIASEIETAKSDLAQLEADSNSLQERLQGLFNEQMVQQEQYDRLLVELETAKKNLEAAIKVHQDAVEDLNQKQLEYENRITSMFRIRNKSTLEVLLESDSMEGFLTNMRLMSYMGSVDNDMIAQLDAAREVARVAKENSEQTKLEYDAFVAEKEVQLQQIADGIAATQTDIDSVSGQILTRSDDVTNLQNQEHGLDSEIDDLMAKLEAEDAARRAAAGSSAVDIDIVIETRRNLDGSEAMIYPVPNYTRLSDVFGWRADPFTGTGSYMHWGVDFPAPAGTPIRASLSGTVALVRAPNQGSTYGGSGLGNYCTIVSGSGIALIYAHQTTVGVYEGQYVNQGEVIGTIGSTGFSTGPHLHFQMRVPWSSASGIDPMPYLP